MGCPAIGKPGRGDGVTWITLIPLNISWVGGTSEPPLKPILVRFKFRNLGEKIIYLYILLHTPTIWTYLSISPIRNSLQTQSQFTVKLHRTENPCCFKYFNVLSPGGATWPLLVPSDPPSTATRTNCNTDAAFIEVLGKDERIYFSFCVITTRRKQRSGSIFYKVPCLQQVEACGLLLL